MRPVVVLQHVAPEGPGRIADALQARGLALRTIRIDRGEPVPTDLGDAAALVVMGGPMGVYQQAIYPHLTDELRLIEAALTADLPVLGVCLGSQLLASALGARVRPSGGQEIGWLPVTLEPAAADDPLFAGAAASFPALHWHGDVFELPAGATALARSAQTPLQAFRHRRAHGLLFHLEATADQVAAMATAFAADLAAAGVDGAALTAAAPAALAAVTPVADHVFARFAASISAS